MPKSNFFRLIQVALLIAVMAIIVARCGSSGAGGGSTTVPQNISTDIN